MGAFMALLGEGWASDFARQRMHEVLNTQRTEFQAHDVEIGFHYDSDAIVGDGTAPPKVSPMGDEHVPTTRPGHRLPHAWVVQGGQRVSTHDLCGRGRFVLLTGANGTRWQEAAAAAAQSSGVDIEVIALNTAADPDGTWAQRREIDDDGAILVRPDVHVGWRARTCPDDPVRALGQAVARILSQH